MEETRSPCETAAPLKCCFVHCTLHRGCVTYGHVSGCTDMNINGGQSVKGTPGPHVCKPTTFPLLGCNSWFPSQEVEKEHKMERTRPRHFSLLIITLFAKHKDNLIRTTACRKKTSTLILQQSNKSTSCNVGNAFAPAFLSAVGSAPTSPA